MFDDSDKLVPLESQPINFPVFAILSNNTLLLAQPETVNSWSLLAEELPRIAMNQ
ncbi:36702_t:CDS:1, partial [Racocetra persica]